MIAAIDEDPDDVAEHLIGRRYLSYSAATTYLDCPLRFKFRYVDGLPEKTVAVSLVFGQAIHRGVEVHFRRRLEGDGAPTVDEMFAAYTEAWKDRGESEVSFGKKETRESLDSLARKMFAAFQASDLANTSATIVGVEEELHGSLIPGCPSILGRIDLLLDDGEAIHIVDLKTARSAWTPEMAKESGGQLFLYSQLASAIAGERRIKVRFAVLTKTAKPQLIEYPVESDRHSTDRTKQIVAEAWRGITSGAFYPRPSPMSCTSCPFREPCRRWPNGERTGLDLQV